MGILVPLLIIALGHLPEPSDTTLANFSRFSKTTGTAIALVDREGVVREGLVASTTADSVTMAFGSGERTFPKTEIVSAERLRDNPKDGAIKGALVGALIGMLWAHGFDSGIFFGSVAVYSGIGWAIDAAQTHRQPIYRAPGTAAAAKPTLTMSLRF